MSDNVDNDNDNNGDDNINSAKKKRNEIFRRPQQSTASAASRMPCQLYMYIPFDVRMNVSYGV